MEISPLKKSMIPILELLNKTYLEYFVRVLKHTLWLELADFCSQEPHAFSLALYTHAAPWLVSSVHFQSSDFLESLYLWTVLF